MSTTKPTKGKTKVLRPDLEHQKETPWIEVPADNPAEEVVETVVTVENHEKVVPQWTQLIGGYDSLWNIADLRTCLNVLVVKHPKQNESVKINGVIINGSHMDLIPLPTSASNPTVRIWRRSPEHFWEGFWNGEYFNGELELTIGDELALADTYAHAYAELYNKPDDAEVVFLRRIGGWGSMTRHLEYRMRGDDFIINLGSFF
jgi:hypothetical protein